jgi:16S rRNA G966 N2-methylase RsmD
VACVEKDAAALACIRANARGTDLQVAARDALRLPVDAFPPQAVIFADPPYEQALDCWRALADRLGPWLDPDGVLVWETAAGTTLPPVPGLAELEARRYGAAEFHLFRADPA